MILISTLSERQNDFEQLITISLSSTSPSSISRITQDTQSTQTRRQFMWRINLILYKNDSIKTWRSSAWLTSASCGDVLYMIPFNVPCHNILKITSICSMYDLLCSNITKISEFTTRPWWLLLDYLIGLAETLTLIAQSCIIQGLTWYNTRKVPGWYYDHQDLTSP